MNAPQRRAARDYLTPRIDAIQAAAPAYFTTAARTWLADHTLPFAWWGVAAMLIRSETAVGLRTGNAVTDIEALLEEVRVAVGGSVNDQDFKRPVG